MTKYAKKCHQKAWNCNISLFLDQTALNFAKVLPKIGFFTPKLLARWYFFTSLPPPSLSMPAHYTDRVDLKDGLLNHRVCTVKFQGIDSYFLCNIRHTDQAINQNGPGGLVTQLFWNGTSLYKSCCSEVHPNFQHSVYQCSLIGLDLGIFFYSRPCQHSTTILDNYLKTRKLWD